MMLGAVTGGGTGDGTTDGMVTPIAAFSPLLMAAEREIVTAMGRTTASAFARAVSLAATVTGVRVLGSMASEYAEANAV